MAPHGPHPAGGAAAVFWIAGSHLRQPMQNFATPRARSSERRNLGQALTVVAGVRFLAGGLTLRGAAGLAMAMTTASRQAARGGTSALLVLDLQVDFLQANGRMPIAREQIAPVLGAANRAIAAAAASGVAVIYVGNEFTPWDLPGNWFRHGAAMRGTPGAALDPRLTRLADAPYFAKRGGDAFANPALADFVRMHRITAVVLCGVYADACVSATAQGALGRGLGVAVLADAVGAASEAARRRALAGLGRAGAGIETTADFVARLGAAARAG